MHPEKFRGQRGKEKEKNAKSEPDVQIQTLITFWRIRSPHSEVASSNSHASRAIRFAEVTFDRPAAHAACLARTLSNTHFHVRMATSLRPGDDMSEVESLVSRRAMSRRLRVRLCCAPSHHQVGSRCAGYTPVPTEASLSAHGWSVMANGAIARKAR
ncbi:hypothetical protein B0H10DRAFT_2196321 [Mycena sp. CBHHK59/15]|nr:hypothetical protein B0H10DRAFT_2196321 [Mycena sp. CBHHK59/15]